jgi:hypothetical protein
MGVTASQEALIDYSKSSQKQEVPEVLDASKMHTVYSDTSGFVYFARLF